MIHECARCGGSGGICPKCGRFRSPSRRKACSCGSRARARLCPGFTAGVTVPGRFLRPEVTPDVTAAHFEHFAVCDCCGIRANGYGPRYPESWGRIDRPAVGAVGAQKPVTLVLCAGCHAHHQLLISMSLERLFTDREGGNVGKVWTP